MRVVIVLPSSENAEDAFVVTSRSLDQSATKYVRARESDALDQFVDLTFDDEDGLLLVRAGVHFLRKPVTEDFVSPVTGEYYLFSDYPQDWFPTRSTPRPRACGNLLFLDRSVLKKLPRSELSLGDVLTTGYLQIGAWGDKLIWREPLIRTLTSNREIDALIVTGIDDDLQRWGYLGIVSQVRSSAVMRSISNQDRARALSRLVSRSELLRALAIRFRLVVLVKKEPYFRLRMWVGSVMLRVPVLRRFVQTG